MLEDSSTIHSNSNVIWFCDFYYVITNWTQLRCYSSTIKQESNINNFYFFRRKQDESIFKEKQLIYNYIKRFTPCFLKIPKLRQSNWTPRWLSGFEGGKQGRRCHSNFSFWVHFGDNAGCSRSSYSTTKTATSLCRGRTFVVQADGILLQGGSQLRWESCYDQFRKASHLGARQQMLIERRYTDKGNLEVMPTLSFLRI